MTCLPLLVLTLTAFQGPAAGVSVRHDRFDDTILEYRAFPAEDAKAGAVRRPRLDAHGAKLLAAFWKADAAPAQLDSVRLAARINGTWLIADKYGVARYGSSRGFLDVLGFEAAAAQAGAPMKYPSQPMKVTVDNRSSRLVNVRVGPDRWFATIPSGKSASLVVWNTTLNFRQDGKVVGSYVPWRLRGPLVQGRGIQGGPPRRVGSNLELTITVRGQRGQGRTTTGT